MAEVFRTDRLAFRTWERADVDALIDLCKKPGLTDFSSDTYKNLTSEKALAFIEKESRRYAVSRTSKFAVYSVEDSKLLGISGIFEMDEPYRDRFEINYRFPSENWGKGIGTLAASAMIQYGFETLQLESVSAIILKENVRSARILIKVGMKVEKDLLWHALPAQLWVISKREFR
jgi:ribosomal-protein-alanine N-acetyltransferase